MNRYIFCIICIVVLAYSNFIQAQSIEGNWYIELDIPTTGIIRTVMTFESKDRRFTAYTRKDADKDFMDAATVTLTRTMSGNTTGSLARIEAGKLTSSGNTITLEGAFISPIGKLNFMGEVKDESLTGVLLNKKNEEFGKVRGIKNNTTFPLSDYTQISKEIIEATESNFYDNNFLKTQPWEKFKEKLALGSGLIQDDIDMLYAFYFLANGLKTSHYNLSKKTAEVSDVSTGSPVGTYELKEYSNNTIYFRISSFSGTSQEIDSLFAIVLSKKYDNLIIDLRDNTGGGIDAGLRTAQYLADKRMYGGVFLTRKWFANNSGIPKTEEYKNFTVISEANSNLFFKGIHSYEGLALEIIPVEINFKGNVYILTNKNTASTCEPLVYGLKQVSNVAVVGEKTAGAMLSSEKFALSEGFVLTLPVADYYAADGTRIEGIGVIPDIEVKSDEALNHTLNNLIK